MNNILNKLNELTTTWSNNIQVIPYNNELIVIVSLTIDNVTRSFTAQGLDLDEVTVNAYMKCLDSFGIILESNTAKETKEATIIQETTEDINAWLDAPIVIGPKATELVDEYKDHPLVVKGLIRGDQIKAIEEFKTKYRVTTDEHFNYYLKNWCEYKNVRNITTKKELIGAGIEHIDNFINFIKEVEDISKVHIVDTLNHKLTDIQLEAINRIEMELKLNTSEDYIEHIENWKEHGGSCTVKSKHDLFASSSKCIDSFIAFMDNKIEILTNGIDIPEL